MIAKSFVSGEMQKKSFFIHDYISGYIGELCIVKLKLRNIKVGLFACVYINMNLKIKIK